MNKLAFARYKSISKGKLLLMITPDIWFCREDLESPISPGSFRIRVTEMDAFEQKKIDGVFYYKISAEDRTMHIASYYSRNHPEKPSKQKITAYKRTVEDLLHNLVEGVRA